MNTNYSTQNDLLLQNLLEFYKEGDNMDKMLNIINGKSLISLRIIDWFATNYAKKNYTVYQLQGTERRFKVYNDYKLKLKAYSKRRFDPFCRWERINIPYKDDSCIQTTIGQLNFFKWALENNVIDYIEQNFKSIELDMNARNSTSKNKKIEANLKKTRKKREELSVSASKSIKKEKVEIVLKFD
jgi:ribosomal protein S1